MQVIDRRQNPSGKSNSNRQRFIKRAKESIRESVREKIQDRKVSDTNTGESVNIPKEGIKEPTFEHDWNTGIKRDVRPGNKDFSKGDRLRKPKGGSGQGGSQGSPDGEDEDDFEFALSKKEFYDIFFEDLELPNMQDKEMKEVKHYKTIREGYRREGSIANLDKVQSYKQSLGRRLALKRPPKKKLDELEELLEKAIASDNQEEMDKISEMILKLKKKYRQIPFFDDMDMRFRNYTQKPQPNNKAVMFCVDGETEYLTPVGWKKISKYSSGTVGQYTEDGKLEFVNPISFIENDSDDTFVKLDFQGIDQMITPGHRFIYKKNGNVCEMTADELMEKHNSLKYGFSGKVITHFEHDAGGLDLSDDEIRLHIAFKADGTYQREHTNRAQFIFSKKRKIDRLISILNSLEIDFNLTENDGLTRIYFSTNEKIDKRFGTEWYSASSSQKKIISDEIVLWDGYKKRGTFSSKEKSDVDFIQFVFSSCGYGTNLYYAGNVWVTSKCSYSERSFCSKTPKKIEKVVNSSGKTYCFNVPSGMLVLRRTGKVFITGNCVMDVSASMGEHEKDLSKRFFMLLYMFLERKYEHTDIVFIRHTQDAKEVDEDEFFHSKETGGTVVSSAFHLLKDIQKSRYPTNEWNIYIAQCSDGDNFSDDTAEVTKLLKNDLLPITQYMAYIQTEYQRESYSYRYFNGDYGLWNQYETLKDDVKNFDMKQVAEASDIWKVFIELFKKKGI